MPIHVSINILIHSPSWSFILYSLGPTLCGPPNLRASESLERALPLVLRRVPRPQAIPAISSTTEEVTTCHHHRGSSSSVPSPMIYLEGRAGSQLALGPSREGLYSLCSLSQGGGGAPQLPRWMGPLPSGHPSPTLTCNKLSPQPLPLVPLMNI